MASHMNDDKIIDIETALAHHEQQITEMSEVITDQWKMIDALKSRLDKLLAKIERLEQSPQEDDRNEALSGIEFARQNTPPHY